MHFWPKFGNTDFNWWWLFARTSSKWGKFWLISLIWPWSSRSIIPKNNRDLNQGLLHLWSKFGDSSLNGWWVIARTSWWLTDRHTHTQATTIPEGQNWPRVKIISTSRTNCWLYHFYMFRKMWICIWHHCWKLVMSPMFKFVSNERKLFLLNL